MRRTEGSVKATILYNLCTWQTHCWLCAHSSSVASIVPSCIYMYCLREPIGLYRERNSSSTFITWLGRWGKREANSKELSYSMLWNNRQPTLPSLPCLSTTGWEAFVWAPDRAGTLGLAAPNVPPFKMLNKTFQLLHPYQNCLEGFPYEKTGAWNARLGDLDAPAT